MQWLLRREALDSVASGKGKVRTFSPAIPQNYIREEHDRKTAAKRAGVSPLRSPTSDEEDHAVLNPASHSGAPDLEYDRAWGGIGFD